jgi:hypothetical protein
MYIYKPDGCVYADAIYIYIYIYIYLYVYMVKLAVVSLETQGVYYCKCVLILLYICPQVCVW